MKFHHINRRTHLYLALALLPWFLIYGVSSIPFSHPRWMGDRYEKDGIPQWTVKYEKPFDLPMTQPGRQREAGESILRGENIGGAFGVMLQGTKVVVFQHTFLTAMRLTYDSGKKTLTVEERRFRWDHFLTGMHARGGFEQASLADDLWAVIVDLVCLGMIVWIASGLIMWWNLRSVRRSGWAAIVTGLALFLFATMRL
ncbi:MAG: hypothetical protein FJW40_03800 [Acidobacteria bacterium]|nr:hypothetical protein [Acidobacteriota bacterium]